MNVADRQFSAVELELLRRGFLDSSDAIMITDSKGVITDVNPAFERIYGYSHAEVVGQTPRLLRSRHSSAEFYRNMWLEILDPSKGFWKGEIVNRCKDGSEIPVLLSITPIRNDAGKISHFRGLAIDLSQVRRLEQEVSRLRREYGAFLRHEMRNLLTVIIGYVDMAKNRTHLGAAKQQEYLQAALDFSQSMLRVIEQLRELEYYEMGRVELDRQPIRLPELVKSVCAQLQPLADNGSVRIEFTCELENDVVLVDRVKMDSVFVNLLKNAIEHVAGIGGEVVSVREFLVGDKHAVSINNRGEPIHPEKLNTFFERFNTTKKNVGGTGLGTTYAQVITRAHGGEVRVTSSQEEGTTVTVLLVPE